MIKYRDLQEELNMGKMCDEEVFNFIKAVNKTIVDVFKQTNLWKIIEVGITQTTSLGLNVTFTAEGYCINQYFSFVEFKYLSTSGFSYQYIELKIKSMVHDLLFRKREDENK